MKANRKLNIYVRNGLSYQTVIKHLDIKKIYCSEGPGLADVMVKKTYAFDEADIKLKVCTYDHGGRKNGVRSENTCQNQGNNCCFCCYSLNGHYITK